jgi:hypothetical protein
MNDLLQQKCYHHKHREAVARCPECKRYFCRECITEHDDRVLCTDCLVRMSGKSQRHSSAFNSVFYILRFLSGTIVLWLAFYYIGLMLLSLPTSFHEGTLWSGNWIGG